MSFVKSNCSRSSSTSNDTKPKTRQRDSGETSSANSDYISSSPNKTKCIKQWYPQLQEKEILDHCPFCQGNCNCNFCLQSNIKMPNIDFNDDVKLQHLHYQISLFLPFLKQIRKEQIEEIVVKTRAKGVSLASMNIKQAHCYNNERMYWGDPLLNTSDENIPTSQNTSSAKWVNDNNRTLFCLPKELGGCGDSLLEIKRILKE
nr:hypothetical protein [Tanacetum cinerariifolium]